MSLIGRKIILKTRRAFVEDHVGCMDNTQCHACGSYGCSVYGIRYQDRGLFGPSMLRECEIPEATEFPDPHEYAITEPPTPQTIYVQIDYRGTKDADRQYIEYNFPLKGGERISDYVHSAFNYEAGDVYGWPPNNIEPEYVDQWFAKGQTKFVCHTGQYVNLVIDIEIVNDTDTQARRQRLYEAALKTEKDAKRLVLLEELLEEQRKGLLHELADCTMWLEDIANAGSPCN